MSIALPRMGYMTSISHDDDKLKCSPMFVNLVLFDYGEEQIEIRLPLAHTTLHAPRTS